MLAFSRSAHRAMGGLVERREAELELRRLVGETPGRVRRAGNGPQLLARHAHEGEHEHHDAGSAKASYVFSPRCHETAASTTSLRNGSNACSRPRGLSPWI